MTSLATLVLVHAHPDDEAFFGGGAVAHYAALGHRVVLITCTSGQLGFDAAGRAGNEKDHDSLQTKITRAGELQHGAAVLGFARVVTLGYDDSGMMGWPENENPDAFMNVNADNVARTVASILDEEDAKVVVTYDEKGFYGHPDHIEANVVTRRAVELSSSVERLYYSIIPEGDLKKVVADAEALGLSMPAWVLEAEVYVADDLVATTLDVSQYVRVKHDSMAAHASQVDNEDLVEMNDELFSLLFSTEYYQRAWSRHETSGDGTDLTGGL
ncbi:MAG: PIG-L family deacetylase [Acidimicrobiales bacterium]